MLTVRRALGALVATMGIVAWAQSPSLEDQYREVSQKIIAAALADNSAWDRLAWLCDHYPGRLGGSKSLERAIAWSAEEMTRDGLENVVTPPVKVPHWVRGEESVQLVEPVSRTLPVATLGGSVATPPSGIEAPVVAVNSFDELDKLGREKVAGKIVLFNQEWEGYGRSVAYRSAGASRAARLGALAVLIRSVTPVSQQSPHTGSLSYSEADPKIPAAAVTVEDALLLSRFYARGENPRVRIKLTPQTLPDAGSANVIGEIRGREKPEEIVVIGGHIDSWDIASGAQDDGSGVITCLKAAALIRKLNLRPRRTLRVVFFTNEENGLRGGTAYREWAGATVKNHVAAIEMDGGAEKPIGFGFSLGRRARRGAAEATPAPDPRSTAALDLLKQAGALLRPIGAGEIVPGGGGADIGPVMSDGVPGLALRTVGARYFEWHHTQADTPDKVKPEELRANVAAMAVMAYVLADMPDKLVPDSK